jgi:hypothetical protein
LAAGVPSLFILWREFMSGKTGMVSKITEDVPQKAATRA